MRVLNNKKFITIMLFVCVVMMSVFIFFPTNAVNAKAEAGEAVGSYIDAELDKSGRAEITIYVEKTRIPTYLKEFDDFKAFVSATARILINNSSDKDTLEVKDICDDGDRYSVQVKTRRLSSRLTGAWNWFAWDKLSSYATSSSSTYNEILDVSEGYLVKSVMKVKGSLPIGQYQISKNSDISITPVNAVSGENLTAEKFAEIAENASDKEHFGLLRLAGLDFVDEIYLKVPGKISYVSSMGVEVVGENLLKITPFKVNAKIIGYDYILNENGEITYDESGKPLTKSIAENAEINYLYGYFAYRDYPNYVLIGILSAIGLALCGFIVYAIVSGKFGKFLKGETFAKIKRHKMIYFMLIPSAVLVVIFCYVPMFGVAIAFEDFTLADGFLDSEWVGFKYFKYIFLGEDSNVFLVFRNTIYIALIRVATNFPAILIFALMINEVSSGKAKSVIRTISYLPNFISWIAVGGMALSIFSRDGGLLNQVISLIKGQPYAKDWYSENTTIWWIFLAISSMWKSLGWGTIIYMSALGCINSELYDACSIDGGGRFRKIITVTIPGIANVIMLQLIMDAGNLIRDNYEQVLALTNGSSYLTESTYIVGSMSYSAVMGGSGYSMATAFGLIQGVIGLILVIITNGIAKKTDNEGVL